jgi:predicted membrane protein
MMNVVLWLTHLFVRMIAYCAMLLGMSFLLSKIVPRMPNKASRFVVTFVLGVPFVMLYGYSKVWVHASSEMSWNEALILALPCALLGAILFTFWGPRSRNSNIQ